jgi:hypothetical protein
VPETSPACSDPKMPRRDGEGAESGPLIPCFHMSQNLYGCGKIAGTFDHQRYRRDDASFD